MWNFSIAIVIVLIYVIFIYNPILGLYLMGAFSLYLTFIWFRLALKGGDTVKCSYCGKIYHIGVLWNKLVVKETYVPGTYMGKEAGDWRNFAIGEGFRAGVLFLSIFFILKYRSRMAIDIAILLSFVIFARHIYYMIKSTPEKCPYCKNNVEFTIDHLAQWKIQSDKIFTGPIE